MKIHVLQHSAKISPGSLLEWANNKGHSIALTKVYDGDPLPELSEVKFLVVLGGPMSVDEIEEHPWLPQEKAFLRQAVTAKKTCLGLCLGSQLLAEALGGTVRRHAHWEVGWHGVLIGSDQRLTAFQWHQDTFDLPPGSVRVATNKITENQGFAFGTNIVGLQFHPEATEEWIRACAEEPQFPEGPHVQKPEHMIEDLALIMPLKRWFFSLLDRMEKISTSARP